MIFLFAFRSIPLPLYCAMAFMAEASMMRDELSALISASVRSASADVHSQPEPMRVDVFLPDAFTIFSTLYSPSSEISSLAKRASGKR